MGARDKSVQVFEMRPAGAVASEKKLLKVRQYMNHCRYDVTGGCKKDIWIFWRMEAES